MAGGKTNTTAKYFMCYLLRSLNPKHPKSTYIGFTVHPKRRIRQHNGIITGGAFRTRKKRPWDMATVVQGFPNKISALQFEYAWTNPNRSRLLKGFVGKTKKYGFHNKMELLAILLSVEPFKNYGLSIHCQHKDVLIIWENLVKEKRKTRRGKLSLPQGNIANNITDFSHLMHSVDVGIGPLDVLDVYREEDDNTNNDDEHDTRNNYCDTSNKYTMKITQKQVPSTKFENESKVMDWPYNLNVNLDSCAFCDDVLDSINGYAKCPHCHVKGHLICMSEKILENDPLSLLPKHSRCVFCELPVKWSNMIVRGSKTITPRQSPSKKNGHKKKN
eukprot:g3263.t1